MKKMKFTICTLFAALTFLVLPSCDDGDDDDNGPGSKEDLIGLWESTHATGWEKEDGDITDQWDYDDTDFRYEFTSDGKCIAYERCGSSWGNREECTYSYSGGTLSITYDNGKDRWTDRGKVKKLTNSELEVEFTESDREDGRTY